MKNTHWTIFIVCFAFAKFQISISLSNNIKVPKLIVLTRDLRVNNETYIDIKVSSKLHLQCEGESDITWITPAYHPVS